MKIPPIHPMFKRKFIKIVIYLPTLINLSSKAFPIKSDGSSFQIPAVVRKSDRKSHTNGGDVSLK